MKNFLRKAPVSFAFTQGTKEILRICQPFLDRNGFEHFYYVRITKKGKLTYLTNRINYALDYWEAGLPLRTGFDESPTKMRSAALLWEHALEKGILDFAKTQRGYDGFSFIDSYPDTVQFVSFLRSSPTDHPHTYYLKNQNMLRCWVREFEMKNRNFIKHAEKNPMILPESYLAPQINAFYPERSVKIQHQNIEAKISFRELDCLHFYCRGFTCLGIASLLTLSPRTVETHLDSVKNSFGLSTRDELATLAYTNPLINVYSPRL